MEKSRKNGAIYIVIAAFLWSLNGVLIKYIPWQPMAISGVRAFLSTITLVLIKGAFDFKFNKHVIFASLSYVSMGILFVYATKLTTAANAIILQYTAPIFVIILSIFFFKKFPTKKQLITVVIAFIGVILFFIDKVGSGAMLGNILAILAGLGYSGMFIFNSYDDSSALDASIIGNALIFLISVPVLLQGNEPVLDMAGVFGIIILGIFQMGISYAFFSKGIETTPSVDASLISMLEAILNPIWVALVIGEIPSFVSLIGGGLVLIAVIFNIISSKNEKVTLENNES
ncbi:DMT family transporter [uncultured Anaerofustis sp.]|uniref:DMT family transporter n=1 Tax=uncultured Anaerofustis sp. TaxID=904996 RepID=UPI0025E23502|nr:DMT family transporter [uncultured Anaerofustis sp.]